MSECVTGMDDDDGFRNWGYYEPSFKGHLNLQLMPSVTEQDTKSFLPARDANDEMVNANRVVYQHPQHQSQHHRQHLNHHLHSRQEFEISEPTPLHMQYMRETWMVHQRDKFINLMPGNPAFGVMPEVPGAHSTLHMIEQPVIPKIEMVVRQDDSVPVPSNVEGAVLIGTGTAKKRQGAGAPKIPKVKKPKKGTSIPKENGNVASQRVKLPKKNVAVVINGVDMDISNIPIPVCTCTGAPQQCYRWGCGGWQSACCTTSISVYPLPMSTKRRGARIAGRKMSLGAFKKVLEKLASEGYNFTLPIDLKSHWARHGTNKFVTIR